jgi:hypothetical protein
LFSLSRRVFRPWFGLNDVIVDQSPLTVIVRPTTDGSPPWCDAPQAVAEDDDRRCAGQLFLRREVAPENRPLADVPELVA